MATPAVRKHGLSGLVLAFFLLGSVLVSGVPALGAAADQGTSQVTFYRDVMPILQENCQTCHRPYGLNLGGMVAPMAFTSYADVRPWAKAMAREVQAGNMPPWHASPEFHGVFSNERTLTEAEVATLVKWARSGAPRGNPADAPEPVVWPDGEWSLGTPDLVVKMTEPYFVEDDVEDLYVNFDVTLTAEMLPEARYVRASEARGGSQAVHHLIARPLGGMAPGGGHKVYPEGYGSRVEPGQVVTFNMHYHKEPGPGTGVWDQSMVAVWFHDGPVRHEVVTRPVGNWTFEIPPGHPNWKVGASMVLEEDTTILAFAPHMHLRGKSARYVAFYPDGTRETLIDVPTYDFNWQTRYQYNELKEVPAGTRIEFTAHFDNSAGNAYNPAPDEVVRYGQPTTAEMMLGWMSWAATHPREEGTEISAADSR